MKKILKISAITILIIIGLIIIRLQPSRIAYGRYAGECIGNCGTIYEVETKNLRIDTTSFWEADHNDLGKLQVKKQRYFEKDNYNDKKISIPLFMLLDPRISFGCPDCHDQGGYYLGFTLLGFKRHFKIDKGNEPFYFTNVTKEISSKIKEIDTEMIK